MKLFKPFLQNMLLPRIPLCNTFHGSLHLLPKRSHQCTVLLRGMQKLLIRAPQLLPCLLHSLNVMPYMLPMNGTFSTNTFATLKTIITFNLIPMPFT